MLLATIEFTPSPLEAKETCRRMYRARKTLLIKFNNDALDESTDIGLNIRICIVSVCVSLCVYMYSVYAKNYMF